jgi:NADPH-dependent 2,4-dienoyl-CoA reductase/sulfur reductase-like enzyme
VIAVGRLAPDDAEALLARGDADFVAMGRKLLADPDLARKLAAGDADDVRPCIYSYRCVGNVFLTRGVRCSVNASTGREHEVPVETPRAARAERVLVVGGGPAGLEAARVAAEAGHAVTLCERAARLGGAAAFAGFVDPPIAELVAWLERRVRAQGVDVRLGAALDADAIARLAPDRVVLATGARRPRPPVPGALGAENLLDLAAAERALRAGALAGRRIAVWGGGPIGLALGVHLAAAGSEVAIVETSARFGAGLAPPRLWRALDALRRAGAALHARTAAVAVEPAGLVVADKEGKESLLPADAILLALPGEPDPTLVEALAALPVRVDRVGDCDSPGLIDLGAGTVRN